MRETLESQLTREAFVLWWQAVTGVMDCQQLAFTVFSHNTYPPATMLWIPLLQQWHSLSDPAMEEALL